MSRAWIAFYMGDYQKDTNRLTTLEHGAYFLLLQECWTHGNIPIDPQARAAVAKLPLREWLKIAPKINPYFQDDGTNKRATKEIEKAETIRTKRALAGFRGGTQSGISKAIARGMQSKMESKREANAYQTIKQTGLQNDSPAEAIHNNNITTTNSVAARDEEKQGASKGLAASPELMALLARKA
jgi:uncharacterized protein YdaU (DUF1376 family)